MHRLRDVCFLLVMLGPISVLATADSVPRPIARHSVEVIALWAEVSQLVRENEALQQPLPDPYIARGDLWRAAGCNEDALADYLKAIQIAEKFANSASERTRFVLRLQESLRGLVDAPVQAFPQDAKEAFREGASLFVSQRYIAALPYLQDAVRLTPSNPVYRSYLAVTFRELGDSASAQRHAVAAANLLRRERRSIHVPSFHEEVQWIQGNQRVWLHSALNSRETGSRLTHEAVAKVLNRMGEASSVPR